MVSSAYDIIESYDLGEPLSLFWVSERDTYFYQHCLTCDSTLSKPALDSNDKRVEDSFSEIDNDTVTHINAWVSTKVMFYNVTHRHPRHPRAYGDQHPGP